MEESKYAQAGVDLNAGKRATALMKTAVQATYTPAVLAGLGSFGGLFSGQILKEMDEPILVASTDGVGTKTQVASRLNQWSLIGHDIVNHCVNDILVQGARPLFFLDYVASSRLDPEQIATVVQGVAAACRVVGCALLGGETAEMPGVYREGELDLVGTVVGVVDRANLIDGSAINYGDIIMALSSNGLHTNGYTLARAVLAEESWLESHPMLDGRPLGEELLAPHRCYLPQITALQKHNITINGLAHITGGGIVDNLPRILPKGMSAVIGRGSWLEPAIFKLIQQLGNVSDTEMFNVFNMGVGMLLVVPRDEVSLIHRVLGGEASVVGEIVSGNGTVRVTDGL